MGAFDKFLTKARQDAAGFSTSRQLPMSEIAPTGGTGQVRDLSPALWFSALQPVPAMAPEGTRPRQWAYPVGANMTWQPGADNNNASGFPILRELGDSWDMLRLAIETVKDRLCAMKWEVRLKRLPGERKSDLSKRAAADPRIQAVQAFLEFPDGNTPLSIWLRMLYEDLLVLDAPSVYLERDNVGRIANLRVIDGATINRVITDQGFTPPPPSVAYQQVIYGTPAVDLTTDDLVYMPRNPRAWRKYGYGPIEQMLVTIAIGLRRQKFQLNYYCYSDDTEVLTRDGWKLFADCKQDDQFATRQINTGLFEWQHATEFFRKRYEGDMIHFTGQSVDMMVTPNHRMLVNSLPRKLGKGKPGRKIEHVILAEDLMKSATQNTKIPTTSVWTGCEISGHVWPADDNRAVEVEMTGDEYCAFMGMYLAEGSIKNTIIQIAQPKDARGSHDLFKSLLEKVFGKVYFGGHQFEISRKNLAIFLKQFGHADEKFIPEDIRNATPRQLKIFWNYYYAGDGQNRKDTQQAFTVSRKLATHLEEIVQKIGWSSTEWIRPAGTARVGNRIVNQREGYFVSVRKTSFVGNWKSKRVQYEGPVSCVVVPNKFLFVRRNGKAMWSGNTEGNIPEAMCFLPPTIPIDRVKEVQSWFDTILTGDLATRRRLLFLPGYGSEKDAKPNVIFPKEVLLKDEMDNWLWQIVAYGLGTRPEALMKMVNRASAETSAESTEEEGLTPKVEWTGLLLNTIIQRKMGFMDLEVAPEEHRETDLLKQAQIDQIYLEAKVDSVNEVRARRGDDPRPEPEADTIDYSKPDPLMGLGGFGADDPNAKDNAKETDAEKLKKKAHNIRLLSIRTR